jgi:hypothetical protein
VNVEYRTVPRDWKDEALDQARRDLERLDGHIGALHAVLAPLLNEPLYESEMTPGTVVCRVCLKVTHYYAEGDYRPRPPLHEPDCAVLRTDELLGR